MEMTMPSWTGKVQEVDATEFNRLSRLNSDPLLLYIGAPWCPPCTTIGPAVESAASTLGSKVRFFKVNAAADSQLLNSLNVASVPMLLLYDGNGKELARFLGVLSASQLVQWIEKNLITQ